MKKDKKLKGQLGIYMRWPLYLTALLVIMNVVVYSIARDAGIVMLAFVLVYTAIAMILYVYNKPMVYTEFVSFATHYGQIQKNLLKELELPYVLIDGDGKIVWMNKEFMRLTGRLQPEYYNNFFRTEQRNLTKSGTDRYFRGIAVWRSGFPCRDEIYLHG